MRTSKKFVRQLLACAPVFLNQFLIGVGLGWTSPTIPQLEHAGSVIRISQTETSWLGSISELGKIVGPIVASPLLDNIGRKNTSILVSLIYLSVWVAVIFARDTYVLLATRVLFGIGNGVTDVASSVYIAEVCSPDYRGISGSGILIAFFAGLTSEFFLATYLPYTSTAIFNAAVAFCAICSQYFAVETTYFLTLKGEHEQARKNLVWLEADSNIEDELAKIRKNVEEEKRKLASFRLLFSSRTNLKAIFAVVGSCLLFSSIGFHTVVSYASMILSPAGNVTTEELTIMFGVAEFVAAIISIFVIEKVDRRPMIVYSYAAITFCNVCTAILLYLHGHHYQVAYYPWLLFACVATYGFVVSLIGPAIYVIIGEILPLSVRAIGSSMAVASSSAGSFLTDILFWPITAHFGMETNFIVYTVTCILVILFVCVVVPETRGKALHDMHQKSTKTDKDVDPAGRITEFKKR